MNARRRLVAAGIATLAGASALAQPHMRPGLWEETVAIKTDNPQANAAMEQMKAKLASMPPDQRAAIEKMMASHGMGTTPGGAPNTVRVCLTKEQIDRGFTPDRDGRCSRVNVTTSGNVTKFDFTCASTHENVTGHGTMTTMGDSAFAVSTVADTTSQKQAMHIQSDIAGKFVASDCGDVKPMETPPAK
jgi:hypothetical protein